MKMFVGLTFGREMQRHLDRCDAVEISTRLSQASGPGKERIGAIPTCHVSLALVQFGGLDRGRGRENHNHHTYRAVKSRSLSTTPFDDVLNADFGARNNVDFTRTGDGCVASVTIAVVIRITLNAANTALLGSRSDCADRVASEASEASNAVGGRAPLLRCP
jgi:hypothetical protein